MHKDRGIQVYPDIHTWREIDTHTHAHMHIHPIGKKNAKKQKCSLMLCMYISTAIMFEKLTGKKKG